MTLPWPDGAEPVPGVYYDITHDEYLSQPGVSVSKLKAFEHCPWKARFGLVDETPAQRFGTLIHKLVLEPDDFDNQYSVTRAERRNTKEWDQAAGRAMGRELVKASDFAVARQMANALYEQPVVNRLLRPGPNMPTEVSFWWRDRETGLLCKARIDALRIDIGYAIDLKSCDDASERGWRRSMENFAYDYQELHYRDGFAQAPGGWKLDGFIFLAAEKDPPFKANGWYLDPEQEDKARWKVRQLLRGWAECEASGYWPGYDDFERPITLSNWRYRE